MEFHSERVKKLLRPSFFLVDRLFTHSHWCLASDPLFPDHKVWGDWKKGAKMVKLSENGKWKVISWAKHLDILTSRKKPSPSHVVWLLEMIPFDREIVYGFLGGWKDAESVFLSFMSGCVYLYVRVSFKPVTMTTRYSNRRWEIRDAASTAASVGERRVLCPAWETQVKGMKQREKAERHEGIQFSLEYKNTTYASDRKTSIFEVKECHLSVLPEPNILKLFFTFDSPKSDASFLLVLHWEVSGWYIPYWRAIIHATRSGSQQTGTRV